MGGVLLLIPINISAHVRLPPVMQAENNRQGCHLLRRRSFHSDRLSGCMNPPDGAGSAVHIAYVKLALLFLIKSEVYVP